MKTYIEIEEYCGNEGETWTTFLVKEGNEKFIEKLKLGITKFYELLDYDNYLSILDEEVDENTVNKMTKRTKSGYYDFYNKRDSVINPNLLNIETEEAYIDSFYKMKLFK